MKQVKRRTNKQALNAQTFNAYEAESTCFFFLDHVTRTKWGTVGSAARDDKLSLTPMSPSLSLFCCLELMTNFSYFLHVFSVSFTINNNYFVCLEQPFFTVHVCIDPLIHKINDESFVVLLFLCNLPYQASLPQVKYS